MQPNVCTHCGKNKRTSRDHVFPSCLFVELSNERPIKVRSCEDCNCTSSEGLLKSFLSLFDDRLAQTRLGAELLHPKSDGDLQPFVSVCTPDLRHAYPEERVTRLFKKLFQGLRRHLLNDKWTFLSADDLTLFSMSRNGADRLVRKLPLCVGGPNEGFPMPPEFEDDGNFKNRFRDFRFGWIDTNVMALKYARIFHGNELVLFGLFEPREQVLAA
jgi:hypothetical protein